MTASSTKHGTRKGRSLRRGITLIAAAALLAVSGIIFAYSEFRQDLVSRRYESASIEVQSGLLDTMLALYRGRLRDIARTIVLDAEIDTAIDNGGSDDLSRLLERARNTLLARPSFAVISASGEVLATTGDEVGLVESGAVQGRAAEAIRNRIFVSSNGVPYLVHYAPVRRGDLVVAQVVAFLEISNGISVFFPDLVGTAFAQRADGLVRLSGDVPAFESAFPSPDGQARLQVQASIDGRRFEVVTLPLRDEDGNFSGDVILLKDISKALEREEVLATLAFASVLVIVLLSLGLLARALRLGFRPLGAVVYLLDAMARGETGLRMRDAAPRPEPESQVEGVPARFAFHSVARQSQQSESSESTSVTRRTVAEIDTLLDTVERFRASIEARNALIAVQEQLESARRIQHSLLPVDFDLHPGLEIGARMRAAQDVGGDFFDAFPVDDGRVAAVIADVSGKGIAAALFAAQASVVLRSHCQTPENLPEQIKAANNALCQRNPEEMFLTAIVAFVTPRTGEVAFVNAGHCPPMIAGPDGEVRLEMRPPNLVLGVLPDVDWSLHHLTLNPGESLLFHSDGFDEAQTKEGEILGRDSAIEIFSKVVREAESPDCTEASDRILDQIDQFAGDAPQADDITLITMRRIV